MVQRFSCRLCCMEIKNVCVLTVRKSQLSVNLSATFNKYAQSPRSRALLSSCPPIPQNICQKRLSLGLFSAKPPPLKLASALSVSVLDESIQPLPIQTPLSQCSRISSCPSGHCDLALSFLLQRWILFPPKSSALSCFGMCACAAATRTPSFLCVWSAKLSMTR
jgi:hypothetical protein